MATMFFSGLEKAETAHVLSRVPGAAGMMSFLQYSPQLFAVCEAYGLRLAMDSGAYSRVLSRKDIESYAKLICILTDRCEWFAAPDHISSQKRSSQNFNFLLSLLPAHLQQRVLWVYQISAPITDLDAGLERYLRVGVGGLVPYLQRDPDGNKLRTVAKSIAQVSGEAHYFGLGRRRWLRELQDIHEGRFSCDHTSWLVGSKYGRLIRNDGLQVPVKQTGFDFSPDEILTQNARTMLKWVQSSRPPGERQESSPLQLSLFDF